LRAQKNAEDESYEIAFNNLRSEVIKLRNEALEKDKILLTLVDKIKEDEAASKAQAEAQKREIKDLQKQLTRAKEERILEETKRELSDQWADHLEINVKELRASQRKCYVESIECVKKIKSSFANVSAFSSEENFSRGNPEGPIKWISHEAEAFEEILNSRGDICAFSGARGIATVLAEASMVGGKFFTDIWDNSGREMAQEIIQKSEKGIHDARKIEEAAEKSTEPEGQIGIS
jgi:hypothetical protein